MMNAPILLAEVLSKGKLQLSDINAIGVTVGPGLKGCLLIGVTFAQGICATHPVPLLPINHIEAHILSAEMHYPALQPPYIALVVSGGHTEVTLVEALGKYSCLCRTRDDAAGEAFDKSANLLGLGYPGGAQLASLADNARQNTKFSLPRVGREMEGFSFSGLKTAVLLLVQKHKELLETDPTAKADIAWTIQDAIVDTLVHKTRREVKSRGLPLVVCGGVSANKELQRRLKAECGQIYVPPIVHCVDNGAMIAYAAARYLEIGAIAPAMTIRSRWPLEEMREVYGVQGA
jgi:N6-L-threonylcarbamoyladenine synthase